MLTPGPSPIIRPNDPAGGGSAVIVISKTCKTDTEDRFPTAASERRLFSTALSGSLRLRWMASMTFGPPGWPIHVLISSVVRPCLARNEVATPASERSTTSASSAVRTMRKPSVPSRHPSAASLSGQTSLWVAITRGPRAARARGACFPAATRPAAPSANKPLTTRSAVVISVVGQQSEQISTASSAAVCPGQESK